LEEELDLLEVAVAGPGRLISDLVALLLNALVTSLLNLSQMLSENGEQN
jgi:hypothetical protein